eukprot:TRINITY_DN68020_c1_g7_i7.p1 TRINITY_DN68020_c1_g7~~TRINITY_DN68020_c1_g7_i7.p1  ORF type:complete len:981 (-),score=130.59 TRINITY_DN68020_c1_g7_i7:114-3056(-)
MAGVGHLLVFALVTAILAGFDESLPPYNQIVGCHSPLNQMCCVATSTHWKWATGIRDAQSNVRDGVMLLWSTASAPATQAAASSLIDAHNKNIAQLYKQCVTYNRTSSIFWDMCWGRRELSVKPDDDDDNDGQQQAMRMFVYNAMCLPSHTVRSEQGSPCKSDMGRKNLVSNYGYNASDTAMLQYCLHPDDLACVTELHDFTCNSDPPDEWPGSKGLKPNKMAHLVDYYESNLNEPYVEATKAEWAFETDETDVNEKNMLKREEAFEKENQNAWKAVMAAIAQQRTTRSKQGVQSTGGGAKTADPTEVESSSSSSSEEEEEGDNDDEQQQDDSDDWEIDEISARKIKLLKMAGGGIPANPEKLKRLEEVVAAMTKIYDTTKVDGLSLDPGIEEIITKEATGGNTTALNYMWEQWHNKCGREVGKLYAEYVHLVNTGARDTGFPDGSRLWTAAYDVRDFESSVDQLWDTLRPLYSALHCYVRGKLRGKHGKDVMGEDPTSPIPANLLGNMWAQDWSNVYDIVQPFKGVQKIDISSGLSGKNSTEMHKLAEDFYTSIGWDPLPAHFFDKSMLDRPADREVECHASAWDFSNDDLRIKMCTKPNQEDFFTCHHEQGHIYYFHQYRHMSYLFRDGPNPGFHEAIGDTTTLSLTPNHLRKLGLLAPTNDENETDGSSSSSVAYQRLINFQMMKALEKIAFLPFGLLIDKWRWSIFRGDTHHKQWNQQWWKLRVNYQGVAPPVARACSDFDGGAKAHVTFSVPYIRYFIAHVLQFQFHRHMCNLTGQKEPHQCSIYGHKDVGKKWGDLLAKGASVHWKTALKEFMGTEQLDSSAILEYFKPLMDWLQQQNKQNGYQCGWAKDVIPNMEEQCGGGSGGEGGEDGGELTATEQEESSSESEEEESETPFQGEGTAVTGTMVFGETGVWNPQKGMKRTTFIGLIVAFVLIVFASSGLVWLLWKWSRPRRTSFVQFSRGQHGDPDSYEME